MSKANQNNERNDLFRIIVEAIRSTLDIEETKHIIVSIIGKTLNADRCFITDYDKITNKFLPIKDEYVSSEENISLTGQEVHEIIPSFIEALKNGKYLLVKNREIFLDVEKQDFTIVQETFEKYGVNSIFAVPLFYQTNFLGVLSIHYGNEFNEIGEFEINLMKDIANQTAMAIYQANLYKSINKYAEKEKALREIMLASVRTFDMKEVWKSIVTKAGKLLESDRCLFCKFETLPNSAVWINYYAEYISSDKIMSIIMKSPNIPEMNALVESVKQKIVLTVNNVENENLPENTKKMLIDESVKSFLRIPVYHEEIMYGALVFHYVNNYRDFTQEDIDVAQAIATQSAIIIHQTNLYETTQKQAKREKILREILEAMRSSLDVNSTKTIIVEEIGKALDADVCFMALYHPDNDSFVIDEYSEYKSSPEVKGRVGLDIKWHYDELISNKERAFPDVNQYIIDYSHQGSIEESLLKKWEVKSGYHFPIYYANSLLGYIFVDFTRNYRVLEEADKEALRYIAIQAGIAIYQANLYKTTLLQNETERFNRQILEILRNTLDKKTIKHLFVKNMGQYFKADRVFFSRYDTKSKMFLSVDKESEYLSSSSEKSFIGYDWSNPDISEHINVLLDKREVKIFDWDKYVKQTPNLSNGFISFYEDANVKSSYSFPVIYENAIMGYFCLEYTNRVYTLSDEEVIRIRSISTQAGIALYHAELYLNAQRAMTIEKVYKEDLPIKLIESVNKIIETSTLLSQNEYERPTQIEYLNNIINSCNQLLELTKDINGSEK